MGKCRLMIGLLRIDFTLMKDHFPNTKTYVKIILLYENAMSSSTSQVEQTKFVIFSIAKRIKRGHKHFNYNLRNFLAILI